MNKNKTKNYIFKIYKNREILQECRTHSIMRFLNNIRTINWINTPLKCYIKVSYEKKKCIDGCICEFMNDGWYTNKKDFMFAFNAFRKEK